jgi:Uma2 family endonuclease
MCRRSSAESNYYNYQIKKTLDAGASVHALPRWSVGTRKMKEWSAELAVDLKITSEEYLQGELIAETKHEYYDGEVYAMAGASRAHVSITSNMSGLLWQYLRTNKCSVYSSDMKVGIREDNVYFYPDVLVSCDEQDKLDDYVCYSPIIIIEVLSESTENYDRREKFRLYRKIPSLREYLLISQKQQWVDIFRLNQRGEWVIYTYTNATDTIEFTSIGFSCQLADLYEGVYNEWI